jgi:hypothetical protein
MNWKNESLLGILLVFFFFIRDSEALIMKPEIFVLAEKALGLRMKKPFTWLNAVVIGET